MRLTLVSTLALAFASANAWSDYDNALKCGRKNPDVNTAIDKFCSAPSIMVPSWYAKTGRKHGGAHVAISGKCNPPQWVPFEYCRMQFTKLCANGDARGFGNQRYGNNKCQGWHIDGKWGLPKKRDAKAEPEAMADAEAQAMPEPEAMPEEEVENGDEDEDEDEEVEGEL